MRREESRDANRMTKDQESRSRQGAEQNGQRLTTCHDRSRLQQTRLSCSPRLHFDSVRRAYDENIGSAYEEAAFDYAGNPIDARFKSSGILDPSHMQIDDVVA